MHTRTAGTPFIHSREVLQAVEASPKGFYLGETDFFGVTFSTARDALFDEGSSRFGDEVQKFIRFDLDALHGEDVTEQMAEAFLEDWGGRVCDEGLLPDFVRQSDAWENWCERRTVRDGLAYTQRGHGTYNTRQQGFVQGADLR